MHVMPYLNSLSLHTPYNGSAKVAVGNGQVLPVHNTCSINFLTPTHRFKLNNIYHVPNIFTSILFVHQFTKDNDYCVSFDANNFFLSKIINRIKWC